LWGLPVNGGKEVRTGRNDGAPGKRLCVPSANQKKGHRKATERRRGGGNKRKTREGGDKGAPSIAKSLSPAQDTGSGRREKKTGDGKKKRWESARKDQNAIPKGL